MNNAHEFYVLIFRLLRQDYTVARQVNWRTNETFHVNWFRQHQYIMVCQKHIKSYGQDSMLLCTLANNSMGKIQTLHPVLLCTYVYHSFVQQGYTEWAAIWLTCVKTALL